MIRSLCTLILQLTTVLTCFGQCEAWLPTDGVPGVNGRVNAMVVWDAPNATPPGPWLVVGGEFTQAGDKAVNNIAAWNGQEWIALGSGMTGAAATGTVSVKSLAVFGGQLIAGGHFLNADSAACNHLARWDGAAWRSLGTGISGGQVPHVSAMCADANNLYVGGSFTAVDGVAATYIASWNGAAWSALGAGVDGPVRALLPDSGGVIAGGEFSRSGSTILSLIGRWGSGQWSAMGAGFSSQFGSPRVAALSRYGSLIVAGGSFTLSGATPLNRLAKFENGAWVQMPSFPDGEVLSLEQIGGDLYAAGSFSSPFTRVARFDGISWVALGAIGLVGTSPTINAVCAFGGRVIVGGAFSRFGQRSTLNIGEWTGALWRSLGTGFDAPVRSFASVDSCLNIGGGFFHAGAGDAEFIAQWCGTGAPVPVLPGVAFSDTRVPVVSALLALPSGGIAVGGTFNRAAGISVGNVAAYDPWRVLGNGLTASSGSGGVYTFVNWRNQLIAGGFFAGAAYNGIARYDGANWQAINFGTNGNVNALAVLGEDLIAGGTFTTASGVPANRIARWTGTAWQAMAGGFNGAVNALYVHNGQLYAAGAFTTPSRIARWDGTAWQPLGAGLDNAGNALAVCGSDLIAGGQFTQAGAAPASRIAAWNGSAWRPMGAGVNGTVYALSGHRSELAVGGDFTLAGGRPAAYFARWTNAAAPWIVAGPSDQNVTEGSVLSLSTSTADGYSRTGEIVRWLRDNASVQDGPAGASVGGGVVSGASTRGLTITSVRASDAGMYRCVIEHPCGTVQSTAAAVIVSAQPCPCTADFDASGGIDGSDVEAFFIAWEAADPGADADCSGGVDGADVETFFRGWEAGGC
ncbi:MAG: immunoglobulin domain-containing protein [Planctomycetes bacterium]|nr:immunoglobulin domain-containing protein [Planctomycetota bacterium]